MVRFYPIFNIIKFLFRSVSFVIAIEFMIIYTNGIKNFWLIQQKMNKKQVISPSCFQCPYVSERFKYVTLLA